MGIREDWNDKILIFDGGMGSLLQGAGLKPGELPETWNIKHPEVLVKIHEDYLNAGANIILSNTFGANRLKYNETAEFNLDEIVDAAMKNARTGRTLRPWLCSAGSGTDRTPFKANGRSGL